MPCVSRTEKVNRLEDDYFKMYVAQKWDGNKWMITSVLNGGAPADPQTW